MKPLHEHMGMYSAYHRHSMNRVIHFIFVPAIVWTLMVWLDLVPLFDVAGVPITLAFLVTGALLVWYLMLDFPLGVAGVAVFTMLLVSAIAMNVALADPGLSAMIAGGVFVASWVFQFIGHGVWEKRRPALFDNLFQTLVAPMFLIAETAFAMGLKKELHDAVEKEMQGHLPVPKRTAAATA